MQRWESQLERIYTVYVCCHLSSAVVFVFRCRVAVNVSLSVLTGAIELTFLKVSFATKEFYFPLKRGRLPCIYQHPDAP